MIKEVLLIHHSHTDIGYTHPQPIVFELHNRFIDTALDLAEQTQGATDEAKFRWTCEVTGITRKWWEQASNADRDRFLAAVHRGQFEVAALEWHLTPLADLRMLIRSLENVRFFRELRIPVRSGMNTDVNGVPWGLVDVLLDHGIDGFSMSINSHLGGPVTPRPGAFRWRSPDKRELTVWNGFQYWHAANVLMRLPGSIEAVSEAMPKVLKEAEDRGYSLPYLPVQITNPHHPDNAAPDATLTNFVSEWNSQNSEIKLRTVLLSDIFDRLRQEELPVLSGDWTDYWNLGAGSSSRETTVYLDGLRTLDAAHELVCWPGFSEKREQQNLDDSHESLALYAEHTWGADCSINAPESVETKIQWSGKSKYAYEGLSSARIVMRDGLHKLATEAGGEEPTFLLYNPLTVPISRAVKLPINALDWALTPGVHHRQRFDGALHNLSKESMRWCNVSVPSLGYQTYSISELPLASSQGLASGELSISNEHVVIDFIAEGGVASLMIDGKEFVGKSDEFVFGVPILERPTGGSRKEIMVLDFSKFEPAEGWQKEWKRERFVGKLLESRSTSEEGAVAFNQLFAIENGDRVEVVYRLFSNSSSVSVETKLTSAGDSSPYSLALPFMIPDGKEPQWHFDTAGAVVEFDKEQLPDSARHYVTARRFVRMQNSLSSMSIATPDLPLWKFGGMFFAPTSQLNAADRESVIIAWLANNYWEVNFLADQRGETNYRFELFFHEPEAVDASYFRALPHMAQLKLHGYRELGSTKYRSASLLSIEGDGVILESITNVEGGALITVSNLKSESTKVQFSPGTLNWSLAYRSKMDGTKGESLLENELALGPRETSSVLLIK